MSLAWTVLPINTDTGHLACFPSTRSVMQYLVSDRAGQHRVQVKGIQTNLQDSTQTQSRLIQGDPAGSWWQQETVLSYFSVVKYDKIVSYRPLLSIEDELSSHSQLKLQQFPEIRIPESSAGPAGLWPSPQVPTSPEVWNGSHLTRWGGLDLLHKHFLVMATALARLSRRPSWTTTRPPTSWKTWTQTRNTMSR